MTAGIILTNENLTGRDDFLSWISAVSAFIWDTVPASKLKGKMLQSEMDFRTDTMQELMRLSSFSSWPEGDTPSPLSLARSGFAYSGQGKKVFCPLCKIELDNLKRGDNLVEEHKKRSPGCNFANQVASVINDSSEPTRPPPEASNSALWDVFRSAVRRSQDQNRLSEAMPNRCLNLSVRVDRLNPDYELLRRECIRLNTFYDWPSSAHAIPEALAREGFFYTGSTDRVRCTFCHSVLHTWVPGDDPKEEHRKHFPQCPFVQNLDVGNIRIEDDVQLENADQSLLSLTGAVTTGVSAVQRGGATLPSAEAFMKTATARAVLEMGFSKENVKQVVQQHLTETGEFFPNAESVVEQLLSMGVNQSFPVSSQMSTASASTATSASPAAASSSATLASPAVSASHVAATSSVAPASLGAETEPRTGEERNEETNVPQNEGVKKGNGGAKKRRRGLRKEKMAASGGGSSSSQAVSSELQAISAEPSPVSVAAVANFPGDESAGLLADPEEEQLMEENSRLKEARTCKVCMDKEVNTVFLPCGHLICCDLCSPKVRNCPLCRTFIRGTVKTYLS